jgi:metal-responsive CopG/Arc/MetJ family transcriptional regulator
MQDNDIDSLEQPTVKSYSVTIDEQLYKRLERHIRILKYVEQKGLTRQKWIMDAIKAKLHKDEHSHHSELPQERFLVLKINKPISEQIESKVNWQKKFRSYSKKQWLIEAICEQLESEEYKTKKFLDELNAN